MLGLAAALVGIALPVQAAPSIPAVNIRLGDLSAGSRLYSSQVLTGKQVVASGGAHVFRMNLLGLRVAQFEMFGNPSSNRILAVESDVLIYDSSASAHRDYALAESEPVSAPGNVIAIPALGTEYFARTQTQTQGKLHLRIVDVEFRRGSVLSLIRATGIDAAFSAAQVATLGSIVDGRILRHKTEFAT